MFRYATLAVLLVGVVLSGVGCGGGSDSPSAPTVVATPAPPTVVPVRSGSFLLSAGTFTLADFSVGQTGRIDARASWASGINDVDIHIVGGTSCTTTNALGIPSGAGCTILCSDTALTGTSASCNFQSTTGNARLFIVNLGPFTETGNYEITLTF
jgi:hypothetical protein